MANSNLHVMRFLGLSLEDDMPDHSVLLRFRTRLTSAGAWDRLIKQNQSAKVHNIEVRKDIKLITSITQSPRKPKNHRPTYEVVDHYVVGTPFGSQARWLMAKLCVTEEYLRFTHGTCFRLWCITCKERDLKRNVRLNLVLCN